MTINFYTQRRADGGERTGIEIDGETALEHFVPGNEAEDSALIWFVDFRCKGRDLPTEAEAARHWLVEMAPAVQAGVREVAKELRAGIDFSAPISRPLPNIGSGISVQIFCFAVQRLQGLDIAKVLEDINSRWSDLLHGLEVVEPLAR